MRQIEFLDGMIGDYKKRIEEVARPFENAIPLLDIIPGINRTAAMAILAEIGADMSQFPDHRHLGSRSGICPGNNESAGKHKGGATRKGSKYLQATLVECAWAASRTKSAYFRGQFQRIASRRGAKRALIAVAHSLLTIRCYVLRDQRAYQELDADFFDRLNHGRLRSYYVKRLKSLGHQVDVKEAQPAA
jgi:transposase